MIILQIIIESLPFFKHLYIKHFLKVHIFRLSWLSSFTNSSSQWFGQDYSLHNKFIIVTSKGTSGKTLSHKISLLFLILTL